MYATNEVDAEQPSAVYSQSNKPILLDFYADVEPGPFSIPAYFQLAAERAVREGRIPNVAAFAEMLKYSAGRRAITKFDPLLFVCIYLPDRIASVDTDWKTSQSRFHLEQYEWARNLARPQWAERRAVIAPRGAGKSVLYFTFFPLWAMAHLHKKFVVALAYSQDLAIGQLSNFLSILDENQLLRQDFPELCKPKRNIKGQTYSDTKTMYRAANNTTFVAKGMGSGIRGLQIDGVRPDWVIADDIEPSDQTETKSTGMLDSLLGGVFYLGKATTISMVGTVVQSDAIMHQVKKRVTDKDIPEWVVAEEINVSWYPAIVTDEQENEGSFWEEKYGYEDYIQIRRRTSKFRMEMMNDPGGNSGGYWETDHFIYETMGQTPTRWLLMVDPAVTNKKKSDDTGFCVAAYDPDSDRVEIVECYGKKVAPGKGTRAEIERLLIKYPRIRKIVIEDNQGKDLWLEVLENIPCSVVTQHTDKGKEYRFAAAVDYYDRKRVLHRRKFDNLESQMIAFPRGLHDDVADAAVLAIEFLIGSGKPTTLKKSSTTRSYV